MARKLKPWKMRLKHFMTQNMVRNTEKHEKIRNAHCNIVKKIENAENETQTLFDLEYSEKQWKMWKMRNAHCRTWSMVRKLKIMENEKHTLQNVKYGEKH